MIKKDKKGISLMILVITIIIMIILAGAGIVTTSTIIKNSKKTTLAEDLGQIEDAVKEYYVDNNTLPVLDTMYNTEEFRNKQATDADKTSLGTELTFNNDDNDNNKFYVIDMEKIKVTSSSRGMGGETSTDRYIVSKDTHTVYYLGGVLISGARYYSITNRIIDIKKQAVAVTEDASVITVTGFENMTVKKSTELPTNTITLNITGTIPTDLKYAVGSNKLGDSIAVEGSNITLSSSNITGNLLDRFNEDKKIYFFSNDKIMTLDISNLTIAEIASPIANANRESEEFNLLTITNIIANGKIYYEYNTRIDETNVEVNYYEVAPDVTTDYLKSFGKIVTSGTIKLPKEIQSIKAIQVDEAGNCSAVITIDNIAVSNVGEE